jgi:phage terminase large subunit GpA-like protein
VNKVVFMKCARIGATEAGLNVVGYFIDQDPSPIFIVQPTVDDAKDFSKEQLTPTIEETTHCASASVVPRLASPATPSRRRSSPVARCTSWVRTSPRGFRRRTARVIVLEEVDGYPPSAGTEGDQIKLAERRATTFQHRRKIYINSTPTLKGMSGSRTEYDESDQRRYFVACPYCEHTSKRLNGPQLKWDDGRPDRPRRTAAKAVRDHPRKEKFGMVASGEWQATNPGRSSSGSTSTRSTRRGSRGPSSSKNGSSAQKDGQAASIHQHRARRVVGRSGAEHWTRFDVREPARVLRAEVPAAVGVLTAGVDVQHDRIEVVVRGVGARRRIVPIERMS